MTQISTLQWSCLGRGCEQQACQSLCIRRLVRRTRGANTVPAVRWQSYASLNEPLLLRTRSGALVGSPSGCSRVRINRGASARHYRCQRGSGRRIWRALKATLAQLAYSMNWPTTLASSIRQLTMSRAASPCSLIMESANSPNLARHGDEPATNFISCPIGLMLTQDTKCRKAESGP